MQGFVALGLAGAALMLFAYAMVSTGRWDAEGLPFQSANLAGAVALLVWAVAVAALPSILLNAVWGAIGLLAVVRLLRRRRVERFEEVPAP